MELALGRQQFREALVVFALLIGLGRQGVSCLGVVHYVCACTGTAYVDD